MSSTLHTVVPPRPTSLNVNPSMFSDGAVSGWNVSLTWTGPTVKQYPPTLYTTRVTLHCEGSETQSEVSDDVSREVCDQKAHGDSV